MPSSPENNTGSESVEVFNATRTHQGRRAPETQRMYELLSDGEWHYLKDVISEMARKVHPGVATRYVEKNRRNKSATRNEDGERKPRVQELSVEHQVLSGKRALANISMKSARNRGMVEFKDEATDKPQVRLSERQRLWNTAVMSQYMGVRQGNLQFWSRQEKVIEEVRGFMPEGVEPVQYDPTILGERRIFLYDPRSGPGWKRWAQLREALGEDRTSDKQVRILEAIREAMALPDSPEDYEKAVVMAGRIRRALDKRELYIAIRQKAKIESRTNERT